MISPSDPVSNCLSCRVKSQYVRREGIIQEILQGNFLDLQDVSFEIQKAHLVSSMRAEK